MGEMICVPPRKGGPAKGVSATGTLAGYKRHWLAGEPACLDCTEANRAALKRWSQANPERAREHLLAGKRRWKRANSELERESNRRRKARIRAVTVGDFTPDQLDARMSMFGWACWMCGGPFEHVDHVKPLARGGAHILSNLRPACASCNIGKGATWPLVRKVAP